MSGLSGLCGGGRCGGGGFHDLLGADDLGLDGLEGDLVDFAGGDDVGFEGVLEADVTFDADDDAELAGEVELGIGLEVAEGSGGAGLGGLDAVEHGEAGAVVDGGGDEATDDGVDALGFEFEDALAEGGDLGVDGSAGFFLAELFAAEVAAELERGDAALDGLGDGAVVGGRGEGFGVAAEFGDGFVELGGFNGLLPDAVEHLVELFEA